MALSPRLLRPRASASGFDPRSIGTMIGWYDFSDTSTLTIVNDLVSEIRNKSGAAANLTQDIEANRPSLSTLGGKQAGLFDGSNDYLFSSTAAPQGFGTMFAAHGLGGSLIAIASFCRTSPFIESFSLGTGNSQRPGGGGRWTGSGGVNTGAVSNPSISGVSVFVTGSTFDRTSAPTIFSNGSTSGGAGAVPVANQNSQTIGSRNVNNTYAVFWDSTIGEVLYYQDILSASQFTAVEQYLKAKWGATY